MKDLIKLFNDISPLSELIQNFLYETFEVMTFRRGKIILKRGHVPKCLYYVKEGILASFYYVGTKRVITEFKGANQIVVDTANLIEERMATQSVIVIKEATLIGIPYNALKQIASQHIDFHFVIKKLMEAKSAEWEQRSRLLAETSDVRFLKFREMYLGIIAHVSRQTVADYLCISGTQLYRLEKMKRKQKH
jgi:CRP-like cAMP-binding protein